MGYGHYRKKKQKIKTEESLKALFVEIGDLVVDAEGMVRNFHFIFCKLWLVDHTKITFVDISPLVFPKQINYEFLKEHSMKAMHELPVDVRKSLKALLYLCAEFQSESKHIIELGKTRQLDKIQLSDVKLAISTKLKRWYTGNSRTCNNSYNGIIENFGCDN
ncbi:hypothetical protein [Moritella yayanosii]|nr:hypothetical protein [Moritella yayanosii]